MANTEFTNNLYSDTKIKQKPGCFHCGDTCPDDSISLGDKYFCCGGCLFVYKLLNEKDLEGYYSISGNKGLAPGNVRGNEYEYLDDKDTEKKILNYRIGEKSSVVLYVPQIYCSACVWLLENLYRLEPGIIESKTDFLRKELTVVFNNKITSLRKIVELLVKIGYTPRLSYALTEQKQKDDPDKRLNIRLAVAGFCFANVMIFALPEYLSGGKMDETFKYFLSYVNLLLSVPALYAAGDYFKSAFRSLKLRNINIDVPLALGILALEARSAYEIIFSLGPGYVDSLAGLVFFLLLGKVFQKKTFHTLSFDRDYKSYFPLSAIRKTAEGEEFVSLDRIKAGDRLIIRNNEIIPSDSFLRSGHASIDYSFITGESNPVEIPQGESLFAGGRLTGANIEVEATKDFSRSYFTKIWNDKSTGSVGDKSYSSKISDTAAKYFTFFVIIIAGATLAYWLPVDSAVAWNAFTSVLVVACPCAIALTLPFTYGTVLRVFARNKLFLRNNLVVEYLSNINSIIFDKTGTLTDPRSGKTGYEGVELTAEELMLLKTAAGNSVHPLSRMIFKSIESEVFDEIESFREIPGKGIEALVQGKMIRMGKYSWVSSFPELTDYFAEQGDISGTPVETTVFVSIENRVLGCYYIVSDYRKDVGMLFNSLKSEYELMILSGDNENEKSNLANLIGFDVPMKFNSLPEDKVNTVQAIRDKGNRVLMVGDGLNDAGALGISNVGMALTEESSNFTPGSDAIIQSGAIGLIPKFMRLSRMSRMIVYASFILSLVYNSIGFFYAAQGMLSPLIAAILMPVSSVSIVLFTVGSVLISSRIVKL